MLVVPLTRAAFPVLPRQPWNWNLEPVTAWIFYINLFQYLTRQVESSANDSAPSVAVPGHLTTKEAHSMKEILNSCIPTKRLSLTIPPLLLRWFRPRTITVGHLCWISEDAEWQAVPGGRRVPGANHARL
ncbi:hypothetical protein IF2G_02526 [Cordyceps javanica]|nr:hypothetical protein IF2G_02526 [Cordyceps javanica]